MNALRQFLQAFALVAICPPLQDPLPPDDAEPIEVSTNLVKADAKLALDALHAAVPQSVYLD
jgi:hypothetical protein